MIREASDQALSGLVGDLGHSDGARVLQTRSKEADPLDRPVEILDVHLSEVVLAEFARQALEADEGLLILRSHRRDQRVKG